MRSFLVRFVHMIDVGIIPSQCNAPSPKRIYTFNTNIYKQCDYCVRNKQGEISFSAICYFIFMYIYIYIYVNLSIPNVCISHSICDRLRALPAFPTEYSHEAPKQCSGRAAFSASSQKRAMHRGTILKETEESPATNVFRAGALL